MYKQWKFVINGLVDKIIFTQPYTISNPSKCLFNWTKMVWLEKHMYNFTQIKKNNEKTNYLCKSSGKRSYTKARVSWMKKKFNKKNFKKHFNLFSIIFLTGSEVKQTLKSGTKSGEGWIVYDQRAGRLWKKRN